MICLLVGSAAARLLLALSSEYEHCCAFFLQNHFQKCICEAKIVTETSLEGLAGLSLGQQFIILSQDVLKAFLSTCSSLPRRRRFFVIRIALFNQL